MTTATEASPFFEAGALAGLEGLRFTTGRRIEGQYSGRNASRQLGGSGEFVDYREYSPGDDLRRLDWRVMGRTGRAYLRLYQDETNLACTLLVDASGSMGFAGYRPEPKGSKLQWAQYFTTALSHLILVGRDHVGLAVARRKLIEFLPATCAPQQRGSLHTAIARIAAEGATRLESSLDDLFLQVRRRGVLMLVSDFMTDDVSRLLSSLRMFRQRGWEVIALHLIHPDEFTLPRGRAFQFLGMEREGSISAQVADIRDAYEARFAEFIDTVGSGLRGVGCDYQRVVTSTPYLNVLRSFLVTRSG